MLGFDRAMADPELLDVATESERHAEDGDAASLGTLVTSWLGLSSGEPAVLQLGDDDGEKQGSTPGPLTGRHQLSEITELTEIPEQPEETEDAEETLEEVKLSSAATATTVKPPVLSPTDTATSPTFRERLANLFSRLQSSSSVSPSVIELPPRERAASAPGPADRRASGVSCLSLDETDTAIPPPSYTLGRPDPILLNPGLLPVLDSPELSQPSPERTGKRRRSGVTASPEPGLLELRHPKHSQYRVRRDRGGSWKGWGRVDDSGRF